MRSSFSEQVTNAIHEIVMDDRKRGNAFYRSRVSRFDTVPRFDGCGVLCNDSGLSMPVDDRAQPRHV